HHDSGKDEQMKNRQVWLLAGIVFAGLVAAAARADEPNKSLTKDQEAIAKSAEAFVEAFHKGDAKALAEFWTADGDYTDQRGRHLKGREAIEKAFKGFFGDNKGLKLRINSDSRRFATADVAIEDGTTEVILPDGTPPSRVRYTIVHVKKDGEWKIS